VGGVEKASPVDFQVLPSGRVSVPVVPKVSPVDFHVLPSGKVSVPVVPKVSPPDPQADPSGKERAVPVPKTRPVDFHTDPSAKLMTDPEEKSKIPLDPKVTVVLKTEGVFPEKSVPRVPLEPVSQRFVPSHSMLEGTGGVING
jgi:hypothetical protein